MRLSNTPLGFQNNFYLKATSPMTVSRLTIIKTANNNRHMHTPATIRPTPFSIRKKTPVVGLLVKRVVQLQVSFSR